MRGEIRFAVAGCHIAMFGFLSSAVVPKESIPTWVLHFCCRNSRNGVCMYGFDDILHFKLSFLQGFGHFFYLRP